MIRTEERIRTSLTLRYPLMPRETVKFNCFWRSLVLCVLACPLLSESILLFMLRACWRKYWASPPVNGELPLADSTGEDYAARMISSEAVALKISTFLRMIVRVSRGRSSVK